jgi:hypothetical protein
MAMTETKLLVTAKQEAENRLVVGKYKQAAEIARITGNKIDPKLESAYQEVMRERSPDTREAKLHQLIERYGVEVDRAIKHG